MKQWTPSDVKALRATLKLSQRAFGGLVGVSEQHIYYLERGERKAGKTLKILLSRLEQENEKERSLKKDGKAKGYIQTKK